MKLAVKILSFVIAVSVAVFLAERLATLIEVDSCIDAGGVYHSTTGVCDSPRQPYAAQLARPGLHLFWFLFLAAVVVPATLVYLVLFRFLIWLQRV